MQGNTVFFATKMESEEKELYTESVKVNTQVPVTEPDDLPHKIIRSDAEIPEWEQAYVKKYVQQKMLNRPSTGFFSMLFWLFFFVSSAFGITVAIALLYNFALQPHTDLPLLSLSTKAPLVIIFSVVLLVILFLFSNTIAIGFIHFYQRIAPPEMRRACLFKPTCSEYAIMAIEKYGLFRALPIITDRFSRCHGEVYKIDYP